MIVGFLERCKTGIFQIALVAQEPVLYNGSVRYNITYGCEWATEEDMLRASKTANVHNFVSELEKGYDTNCGEKGVQMSGKRSSFELRMLMVRLNLFSLSLPRCYLR